jgi:hypothetical protein
VRGSLYNKVKKVVYQGITFDSKLELLCYQELDLLRRAGEIEALEFHPARYPLVVGGIKICTYEIDFVYTRTKCKSRVAREVKGFKTAVWRLKWKLFTTLYKDKFHEFEVWPSVKKRKVKRCGV